MAVATTPWTTPAIIGASWGTGWTLAPLFLVVGLLIIDLFIYLPFFKMFEKQLLEEESKVAAENAKEKAAEGTPVTA